MEIVLSSRPTWEAGAGWRLAPEPLLELGAVESDSSQMFDGIVAVRMLARGRVVVAESATGTLRWYGPDGTLLATAGGRGEGPGEFTGLSRLFQVGSESWAFESSGPGAMFDDTGRRHRDVLQPSEVGRTDAVGVFADGSVLWNRFSNGQPIRSGVYEDSATLVRTLPGGGVDTVARLPETRYVEWPGHGLPLWQTFGPRLWAAVRDTLLYTGYSDRFDVSVHRPDGTVLRRVRRPEAPIPVTGEHIAADLAAMLEGVPPQAVPQRRAMHEVMVFPERFPAHGELLVDHAGDLWVRRLGAMEGVIPAGSVLVPSDSTRWDVFEPSGVWLGTVSMPPRFRPEDIGEDRVAGVWKDGLDVEYVRVYQLRKG